MPDAFENMDRMYRLQRYFYDATRKYYLLGRDQLLNEMSVRSGERVLEVGCGTARNLIILARRHPDAHFYGLDASAAMLETAQAKTDNAGLKNITLKTALADDFSFDGTFGLAVPFDKIFFSYSISMIPPWQRVDRQRPCKSQTRRHALSGRFLRSKRPSGCIPQAAEMVAAQISRPILGRPASLFFILG